MFPGPYTASEFILRSPKRVKAPHNWPVSLEYEVRFYMEIPSLKITICNAYAPVHSKEQEQFDFFKNLIKYTNDMNDLILGGDINICLNHFILN